MNTDAPSLNVQQWPSLMEARERVLGMQTKLHRWSKRDATARFDDLFNLVVDPAFLRLAWERVAGNTGARSAGIDGLTVRAIEAKDDRADFLSELRFRVKSGEFAPSPVKQRKLPKSPGTYRTRTGRGTGIAPRDEQRADGGDQWTARTPPWLRSRVP